MAWEEIEDEDQEGDENEPEGHGKTRNTVYVYDHENIILEYNQKGKVKARYTHGLSIDEPLVVEKGRQVYYYQADGLGSIVGLINERGRLVQKYDYDSFGNMSHNWHPIKQPYTFTGREYDAESGLYYYRARYYDPRAGRFLTKDPIGFGGGDVNLYRYVQNNPLNWVDPFGLQAAAAMALRNPFWGFIPPTSAQKPLTPQQWGEMKEFLDLFNPNPLVEHLGGRALDFYNYFSKKSKPYSKPKDCPSGTKPIDEYPGLDRKDRHKIKDGVGAGPTDWTGITPDGRVVTGDFEGKAVDRGPYKDYLPKKH